MIERLGEDGDGVATDPRTSATVHFAGGLPGERYASVDPAPSPVWLRVVDSLERTEPPCRHAGRCGGCTLQHMSPSASLAWKQSRVEGALLGAGHPVTAFERRPAVQSAPFTRRRMELAARRISSGLVLGLHVRGSKSEIVDLDECHVLSPALFALVAPLRNLLATLPCATGEISISANAFEDTIDVVIATARAPAPSEIGRLAAFAGTWNIARISWRSAEPGRRSEPQSVATLIAPAIRLAGSRVMPPPGVFLQATEEAEAAIIAEVLTGLPARLSRRAKIVELFAGIGTLSFPLATRARVDAYEGAGASFAALAGASGGTRVTAHRRDLAREPVSVPELRGAAVAVLDPPHAGALAQIRQIAAARIPTVIMVSCNPATLGRDAAVLADAGFRLRSTRTIDQFLWSARVESVSTFKLL